MCVVVPFILGVRFVDIPAGVTQDFSSTVKSNFVYLRFNRSLLVGHFLILFIYIFVRKNPSSCDDTEIRTHVPTSEGFEVTN